VTVRKYSAWEKYCYVASARRRATVDEKGGGIVSPHAQLVLDVTGPADSLLGINLTECGLLENDSRSCV